MQILFTIYYILSSCGIFVVLKENPQGKKTLKISIGKYFMKIEAETGNSIPIKILISIIPIIRYMVLLCATIGEKIEDV